MILQSRFNSQRKIKVSKLPYDLFQNKLVGFINLNIYTLCEKNSRFPLYKLNTEKYKIL